MDDFLTVVFLQPRYAEWPTNNGFIKMIYIGMVGAIFASFMFFAWHLSIYKKLLKNLIDSGVSISEYSIHISEFPYPSSIVNTNKILESEDIRLSKNQQHQALRAKKLFMYHFWCGLSFIGVVIYVIYSTQ